MRRHALLSADFFLLAVSAALYTAAYDYPSYAWWLAGVALVPFFIVIERARSMKQLAWFSLVFGMVVAFGVFEFIVTAYQVDTSGIPGHFPVILVLATVWISTFAVFGAFFSFFAIAARKLMRGTWSDAFVIPALWVFAEFARSVALSVLFLGSSSFVGPYWTMGAIGFPFMWSSSVSPLASLGGLYLVAFVAVAINYAFFTAYRAYRSSGQGRTALRAILIPMVVGLVYLIPFRLPLPQTPPSGPPLAVTAVSTNVRASDEDAGSAGEQLKGLVSVAVSRNPDVILLPEGASAFYLLGEPALKSLLGSGDGTPVLIDSYASPDQGSEKERILAYAPGLGALGVSDKKILMPYGEYVPYIADAIANLPGFGAWKTSFASVVDRPLEPGVSHVIRSPHGTLGVLSCSEIIPETSYRELALQGASVFFNIASHATFLGDRVSYYQVLSEAKFQAIANGRPLVEAGNYIPSFAVDAQGNLMAASARGADGVLMAQVQPRTGETFFTRFGDWFVVVALAIVAVALLGSRVRARHFRRLSPPRRE